MDTPIFYNHTIPNSGAYRPVRAESGEYLYCPPQRWLNNLHHGATVLLYHPCSPLRERLLLSVLARSCLPDSIMTSHPQLNKHRPIALVSWGHTLELSTAASSDICDWLETTASTRNTFGGVSQSWKYNLLLTRSAEQHRQQRALPGEHSAKLKESVKRCCEQTISSLLSGAMETQLESSMKKKGLKLIKEEGKRRQIRDANKGNLDNVEDENERGYTKQNNTNRTSISRTRDIQNYNNTLGPSAGNNEAQSEVQNTKHGLTPSPLLGSNMSETSLRSDSSGLRAPETLQTAAQQTSTTHTDPRNPNPSAGLVVIAEGANSEHNNTVRPEAQDISSKHEGTAKHRDKNSIKHSLKQNKMGRDDTMKDNEALDIKERELEHKHSHSHHTSEKSGSDSVSKSKSPNPQTVSYLPNDCDSCKAGEHCECSEGSGATAVNFGLPRTPRTEEAVWAAAALGFLLILLTLSVLHTRLYRHWTTTPSLYWHDPQRDYDSVADVIRRRLRIANRRRKRSRRQECVLLPSSSSSDDHP
ncbi:uncharacterized protein tp53i13 [Eleginops maclovinus]